MRADIGLGGARRIGHSAHLLVWCDGLVDEACPVDALPHHLEIVEATLGSAGRVAQRLLALQAERGERTMVAVVMAGSPLAASVGGRALAEASGAAAVASARERLESTPLRTLREFSPSA